MAVASSSGDVTLKYDVFLSFSGVDTRKGFTNTLFENLKDKGIDTFIDDGLPRGEQIEASLVKTIKESRIAVVVFSKNYASSSWCLDELAKINEFNLKIIPIFYDVKPADVLNLFGEFGEKFAKLKSTENKVKIEKWSHVLAFAATQSGWDLNNYGKEIDVIKKVTHDILKYMDPNCSACPSEIIGIASLVNELESLLNNEPSGVEPSRVQPSGVQFYGLWGMGGIGKTTIANTLYHQLSTQFDGSYFCSIGLDVNDIRKLVDLRNEMIFHILNDKCDEGASDQPCARVIKRLQKKKVLIVLDNVSTNDQVKFLVGPKANRWFASESKIIVTSRDYRVLKNEDMKFREIKKMSTDCSFTLFRLHAFERDRPLDEDYKRFSKAIVEYTKGHPLALKVLGRDLYGRTKDEWRSTLEALATHMPTEIEEVLKISYNNLSKIEKEIFLDIACFFKGYDKDWVKDILVGCGFKAPNGIAHLIEKCLVTLNPNNKLEMHDLLQKMGQNIVEEQSRLSMLKRIRRSFDSYNLLVNYEEASKTIEGIFLNVYDVGIEELNIHPMIFSKMQNLRLLVILQKQGPKLKIKIQNGLNQSSEDFYGGIQFLPNDLRVLCWDSYPGEFLPSNFSAENLVILNMRYSKLQQLWNKVKNSVNLKNLKIFNVSGSKHFTALPDFTSATKLEKINLGRCERLCELPNNFGQLNYLEELRFSGCKVLLNGSLTLSGLNSIKKLYLDDCGATEFPSWVCTLSSLQLLDLSKNDFVKVPDSIRQLSLLKYLSLSGCKRLQSLPAELLWKTIGSDIADGELLEPDEVTHRFFFAGCESLDEGARRNIVEKTMMKIQHIANRKDEVLVCSLSVRLPGNKISDFFEGRYTSCVTIKLPTVLSGSTVRGLVFVFIAGYGKDVLFECTLKKADGSYMCSFKRCMDMGGICNSDTLCLHYLPSGLIRDDFKDNLKDATYATFRFQRDYRMLMVRECRVHLVYANHEV